MPAGCLAGLVGIRYVLPVGVLVPEPGVRDGEANAQEPAALGSMDEVCERNACGVDGWAILGQGTACREKLAVRPLSGTQSPSSRASRGRWRGLEVLCSCSRARVYLLGLDRRSVMSGTGQGKRSKSETIDRSLVFQMFARGASGRTKDFPDAVRPVLKRLSDSGSWLPCSFAGQTRESTSASTTAARDIAFFSTMP